MRIFDLIFLMAMIPFAFNLTCALEIGGIGQSACLLKSSEASDGVMNTSILPEEGEAIDLESIKTDTGEGSFMTAYKGARGFFSIISSSVRIGSTLRSIWTGTLPFLNMPSQVWVMMDWAGVFIYTLGLISLLVRMIL